MEAGGQGFEPRLNDPESSVLPLNYPPMRSHSTMEARFWQMEARTRVRTRSGFGGGQLYSASCWGILGVELFGARDMVSDLNGGFHPPEAGSEAVD